MSKTRASNYGRRKNNPFSTSTFKLEGLSQFDWSHTIAYDTDFGDLRPIACFDNILGQRTRCNLAYVLNMDPLRKPLYSGISVTYDAVYVSDQLLGYDSQKWFNPVTTDEERDALSAPNVNAAVLLYAYYTTYSRISIGSDEEEITGQLVGYVPRPIYNTIYESLGFPFNSRHYDTLQDNAFLFTNAGVVTRLPVSELLSSFKPDFSGTLWENNSPYFTTSEPTQGSSTDTDVAFDLTADSIVSYVDGFDSSNMRVTSYLQSYEYIDANISGNYAFMPALVTSPAANIFKLMSPLRYLFVHSIQPIMCTSEEVFVNWCISKRFVTSAAQSAQITFDDIDFDAVCRYAGYSSLAEYWDVYRSYMYVMLYSADLNELIDMRPILAYRRAYNDLYVNTNLWDCDTFSEHAIESISPTHPSYNAFGMPDVTHNPSPKIGWAYIPYVVNKGSSGLVSWFSDTPINLGLLKRWWSNDMFTSAVPADMSAAANAVEIPSSGVTLVDLRNLNIMQEVQERENYAGQRVTDTTFAFFGFKSPELNYYYARHISRITDSPTIQNVLQNSETAATPQANPAGYGTGAKSARFFDFQNPWYGLILILSSVMTEPVYKDAVSRMILKKDYEDFLFPPYQEISDVSVDKSEVQAGETGVFGYQRSYYYYMRMNHRLSGTMRLRQKEEWNTARDFRDGFALNADFAMPNSSDRLNRIFADQSDGINHFNFFVGIDVQTILPLKRDIHYHL